MIEGIVYFCVFIALLFFACGGDLGIDVSFNKDKPFNWRKPKEWIDFKFEFGEE